MFRICEALSGAESRTRSDFGPVDLPTLHQLDHQPRGRVEPIKATQYSSVGRFHWLATHVSWSRGELTLICSSWKDKYKLFLQQIDSKQFCIKVFEEEGCEVRNCEINLNRTGLAEADLVLFKTPTFKAPTLRKPKGQVVV